MAGKLQIQESFQKVYDLEVFKREILNSVFTSEKAKLFREENYIDESNQLTASEKKAIGKVVHYGNLELDDYNTLKLYEITLQPKVRIEQSKVGIQQYVRKMLIAGEGVLVNFINPDNLKTWRLTLVASDTVLTDKGISVKKLNPKRYTFIVGQSEKCKTISDRFADLEKASRIVLYPSENEKSAISLVNIFSVETLSKAFFDEYTLHYKLFTEYLQNSNFRKSIFNISIPQDAKKEELDIAYKPIRDFVKKMLGRIVFLYFVQKKGWLGASNTDYSDGSDNFIFLLFQKSGGNENFYYEWLSKLFFETLNKQRIDDVFIMPDTTSVKIPYLNGGLFDPEEYDNKLLTFTPTLFHSDDFEDTPLTEKLYKKNEPHRGFLDFLNAFNFTVHEDSPEDQTVAVDPEMLGHIFENLLEDNKDKGAFYTPKEIVHYMCQESLIEYLNTHLNPSSNSKDENGVSVYEKQNTNLVIHSNQYYEEDYSDIVDFVKNKTINDYILKRATEVNKYLDAVKICDPAIGSGAFPMGLLQEIFAIKELIAFATNSEWEPAKAKENIIQNSIYGVDIEKGAVDIARLRFWLSLIVNEEKPKALPNLDYKIVVGDSLLSKFGEQVIDIDWDIKGNSDFQKKIKKSIEELVKAKKDFFELKKEKLSAKKDIRTKTIDLLINILTFDKEKYFKEHSKTKSLFEQTAKEKQQQLEFDNHIYGFDKAITDLKVLKGNNEKFEFFDWKIDFADLINENISDDIGFDIVIGNPPYVTYKGKEKVNISEVQLKKLIENYPNSAEYKVNSYALFIESGLKLLKNNGNINYIIPGSILQNEYLKNIRKHLIIDNNLSKIVAFGNKVFNAVTDSIILIATKNTNQNKFCSYLRKTSLDFTVNDEKNYEIKNWDNGIDYVINLKTNDLEDIILKDIENDCQFIDDFLEVYVGIVAKGIKQFLFEEKVNKNFKKYLQGKHMGKYLINPESLYINFIKDKLHSNTDENVYNQDEKILVRKTGNKLMAVIDDEQFYTDQSLYNLYPKKGKKINLFFITALLNSKILDFYFNKKMITNADVFPYIKGIHLKKLPIKFPKDISKFVSLVRYINFTKKEEFELSKLISTYFEQIIDGMVYELYFPELLKQHNRTIIEHLGELPEFTDTMNDSQKMEIINTVFNRLNEKNHPVRVNLFYMNSIPEIKIIEGVKE